MSTFSTVTFLHKSSVGLGKLEFPQSFIDFDII